MKERSDTPAQSSEKKEPRISEQWDSLAAQVTLIQDAKNRSLNPVLLSQVLKIRNSGEVFDYGCGWGEWADLLYRSGFTVTGYDASNTMIQNARSKFGDSARFLSSGDFAATRRDLEGKFDLVTSNLVLCVMTEAEQRNMLSDILRLLKEEGTVILSFCHPFHDFKPEGVSSIRHIPEGARYEDTFVYSKTIKENGMRFDDHHRPLAYYEDLFKEFGLEVIEQNESDTLGTKFEPEFIVFTLRRAQKKNSENQS